MDGDDDDDDDGGVGFDSLDNEVDVGACVGLHPSMLPVGRSLNNGTLALDALVVDVAVGCCYCSCCNIPPVLFA